MARKKANRGVKGEGYFSQVGGKYIYKIPAGTHGANNRRDFVANEAQGGNCSQIQVNIVHFLLKYSCT